MSDSTQHWQSLKFACPLCKCQMDVDWRNGRTTSSCPVCGSRVRLPNSLTRIAAYWLETWRDHAARILFYSSIIFVWVAVSEWEKVFKPTVTETLVEAGLGFLYLIGFFSAARFVLFSFKVLMIE